MNDVGQDKHNRKSDSWETVLREAGKQTWVDNLIRLYIVSTPLTLDLCCSAPDGHADFVGASVWLGWCTWTFNGRKWAKAHDSYRRNGSQSYRCDSNH